MAKRPLSGAREKVRRANQHIHVLDAALGELQNDRPYGIIPKTNSVATREVEIPISQATPGITQYYPDRPAKTPGNIVVPMRMSESVGIYIVTLHPLPLLAWGTLIGDVVHNLRSALDQLVWELSIHHQKRLSPPVALVPTKDTIPPNSPWRFPSFPVVSNQTRWTGAVTSSLRLLDQNLVPKIESEQPFQRGKQYQRHWLWLLNELWNRDKHRSIAVTAMYTALTGFRLHRAEGEPLTVAQIRNEFDVQLSWGRSVGRYVDGMELAEFQIIRKNPRFPEIEAKFDVEANLALDIRFKKAAPTYGARVFDALNGLSANVERVLDRFQGDFN